MHDCYSRPCPRPIHFRPRITSMNTCSIAMHFVSGVMVPFSVTVMRTFAVESQHSRDMSVMWDDVACRVSNDTTVCLIAVCDFFQFFFVIDFWGVVAQHLLIFGSCAGFFAVVYCFWCFSQLIWWGYLPLNHNTLRHMSVMWGDVACHVSTEATEFTW